MKHILALRPSRLSAPRSRNSFKAILALGFLVVCLFGATGLRAGTLYVPNGSFETPVTTNLDVRIDAWQINPQPPFFDPNDFGGNPWFTLMGRFVNTDIGSFDHLDNIDGSQAAYMFTFPGAGFFQDNNSVDWTGVASHAFSATYEAGHAYHLTTAFTSSSNVPLTNGASLEMALYYRDGSNNIVTVAATNIIFDTNVFTNLSHFVDFSVDVPTVTTNQSWAGQPIGIQFISTTYDTNLITGVWDLDNVRLSSTIVVPNGSFETPPTTSIDIRIDSWENNAQSPYFDTNQTGGLPWSTFMGRFVNTPEDSFDHLDNLDGTQAAYVFTFPGAGFFQDFNSIDWSNTVPTHGFDVVYKPGRSYTLTAAITSSSNQPLTNGASLQMALYYGSNPSNMIVLAANNVVFDMSVFTNLAHFLDFSATIPEIKAADAGAGQHIGIQFISTTYDTNLITGVWDLDNVRLTETVATKLSNPAITNGQINFTLQSEPGLTFEMLATTNLTAPVNWTNVATLTNITGSFPFSDSLTNGRRFYKAHQLP